MAQESKKQGVLSRLSASVDSALTRLAGTKAVEKTQAGKPSFVSIDPTTVMFPDARDVEDSGALPLGMMLEKSAHAMVRRADDLREDANKLIARIGERVDGEVTLRAQGARVIISLVWLGTAAWLYISGLNAEANNLSNLPDGMPAEDAFVLVRTFFTVAAAGIGVAFAVAALTNVFGNGDNRKVREEGEQLGLAIADASREFDDTLTDLRSAMDRRNNPADSIKDLSAAHMTALEACAYFRDIGFLTSVEGAQAQRLFRGFLHRGYENPPPMLERLSMFVSGAGLGALFVYLKYVPRPEAVEPATPLAILQYPWALALLLLGGLAYAGVGVVFSLIPGLAAGDTEAKAREEALSALRGAFTSREAPRPNDVIRRIEDAVAVFRARIGGRALRTGQADANQQDPASVDLDGDDTAIPAWRKRDSSVKFVETGFQAAPREWRTDAYANFSARKPGAKRDR